MKIQKMFAGVLALVALMLTMGVTAHAQITSFMYATQVHADTSHPGTYYASDSGTINSGAPSGAGFRFILICKYIKYGANLGDSSQREFNIFSTNVPFGAYNYTYSQQLTKTQLKNFAQLCLDDDLGPGHTPTSMNFTVRSEVYYSVSGTVQNSDESVFYTVNF